MNRRNHKCHELKRSFFFLSPTCLRLVRVRSHGCVDPRTMLSSVYSFRDGYYIYNTSYSTVMGTYSNMVLLKNVTWLHDLKRNCRHLVYRDTIWKFRSPYYYYYTVVLSPLIDTGPFATKIVVQYTVSA